MEGTSGVEQGGIMEARGTGSETSESAAHAHGSSP